MCKDWRCIDHTQAEKINLASCLAHCGLKCLFCVVLIYLLCTWNCQCQQLKGISWYLLWRMNPVRIFYCQTHRCGVSDPDRIQKQNTDCCSLDFTSLALYPYLTKQKHPIENCKQHNTMKNATKFVSVY